MSLAVTLRFTTCQVITPLPTREGQGGGSGWSGWSRQSHAMPQPQGYEQAGQHEEGDAPCHRDGLAVLQPTCEHDQETLPEDVADAVEGAADAYVEALVVGGEPEDVETVGSDVVGGAGKGQ